MAQNGGKLGVFCPEGSTVFDIAAGRYSDGAGKLDAYLSGYSGDTLRVDRIGRERDYVENPALTLNLMIQPGMIAEALSNKKFDASGLLARFLYCFPRPMSGRRKYDAPPVGHELRALWGRCITSLLDAKDGGTLTPEPDARPVMESFQQEVEGFLLSAKDDYGETLDRWTGKMEGQTFRIAGVLHTLKMTLAGMCPDALPVDAQTVEAAQRIGLYYKAHAFYAFRMGGTSETEQDAKYILKHLLEHVRNTGSLEISKHDCIRLCRRFRRADEMTPGLDELEQRGYIRVTKTVSGGKGRPSETIEINPCALN